MKQHAPRPSSPVTRPAAPRSAATADTARLVALQRRADTSPAAARLADLQRAAGPVAQRQAEEEELQMVQRKRLDPGVAQLQEEEEELQMVQRKADPAAEDRLPPQLKAGLETLSGMAMDDVQVHRNSTAPAAVGAHAYAQGSDIHLASGQDRHLPHEAWHVVQQRQGRVAATAEANGVAINDDRGLEQEADTMGAKAAATGTRATG